MAVTANLKLRDKRVISLISDMLVDQTDIIKESSPTVSFIFVTPL